MTFAGANMRERLVEGAADLIGRCGLRGATVRELAQHSQTPEGSTYHYFPGGKQQLAAAAVRFNGERVSQVVTDGLVGGPVAGLRVFVQAVRTLLIGTEFRGGCPVLAIAAEGPDEVGSSDALTAADEVFDQWNGLLAGSLEKYGVNADRARQVGILVVAALEGAVAMCRAKQSITPLDDIAVPLESLVMLTVAIQA